MKILLLAAGSQGDVRPFAALGAALRALGHDVCLATHEAFRGTAEAAGLEFSLIRGNPMDIVQGEAGQAWLTSMNNPVRFLQTTSRVAGGILDSLNDDAWEAARGRDAIIYSMPLSLSGHTIAGARGIPGIPAALYPLHPTRAFPSIMTPNLPTILKAPIFRGLEGAANRLSGILVMEAFWLMFRSHQNRWRKKRLGLPPLSLRAPLAGLAREGVPVLYGFSPSIIPEPRDWGGAGTVCGYWFLGSAGTWTPPQELVDFLREGPPPIYVGFGSMASEDPGRMAGIVLEAVRRAGVRAVLASGWGGLRGAGGQGAARAGAGLPSGVMCLDFVPHDWLFTHVCGAVHHGGAGTTAAALRAGIPSVIVPFFADQFFWGSRLNALGLSPKPIAQRSLTAESLEQAIRMITRSEDVRARCRDVGVALQGESGAENAAAVADRYLRSVMRASTH